MCIDGVILSQLIESNQFFCLIVLIYISLVDSHSNYANAMHRTIISFEDLHRLHSRSQMNLCDDEFKI